jgi:hypothetical protein
MVTFMTKSGDIMGDLCDMLLTLPAEGRCSNEEVIEVTEKFKNVLCVFDGIFSLAHTPSGQMTEDSVSRLQSYVTEGMTLWREMELSTEAPKPHAIEDHLVDQVVRFHGIGDLGEDFVEQSHLTGIRDHERTRTLKDREEVANIHCRWEHKRKLQAVLQKIEDVTKASIRKKRVVINNVVTTLPISREVEKKQKIREEKLLLRNAALVTTSSFINGVYLNTGRKKKLRTLRFRLTILQLESRKG